MGTTHGQVDNRARLRSTVLLIMSVVSDGETLDSVCRVNYTCLPLVM